jgi:copper chaperone
MQTEPTRVVYSVPAVMCQHCQRAIEGAVGGVEGVESVAVDLDEKVVEVRFAPGRADTAAVRRAIEGEGYEVAGERLAGG